MKRIFLLLAIVFGSIGFVAAQNGNGNGVGNSGWSNSDVVHILQEAQPFFAAQTGINLGQLIQAYRRGECTIEWVATNPPSMTFRVRYGGAEIILIIDNG